MSIKRLRLLAYIVPIVALASCATQVDTLNSDSGLPSKGVLSVPDAVPSSLGGELATADTVAFASAQRTGDRPSREVILSNESKNLQGSKIEDDNIRLTTKAELPEAYKADLFLPDNAEVWVREMKGKIDWQPPGQTPHGGEDTPRRFPAVNNAVFIYDATNGMLMRVIATN